MDEDSSDQQASADVTPASSENDLLANKSEDSVDDGDDEEEDDDDIDKMLSELQSFQEVSVFDKICPSLLAKKYEVSQIFIGKRFQGFSIKESAYIL